VLDPTLLEIAPPGPGNPGLPLGVADGEALLYGWAPIRPLDTVRQHLQLALISIEAKRSTLDRRWNYYLGRHDEKVLSEKLRLGTLPGVLASMFTNYCSLVVEQPLTRLNVTGWKGDQSEVDRAQKLWEENDLDIDAEEVHRHVLCAGEAYVIVWPRTDPETGEVQTDENGREVMDLALQDARNMHVFYGSRRAGDARWACKVWLEPDLAKAELYWRVVMYYPDEIVRLVSRSPAQTQSPTPRDPNAFVLDEADPGGPHDLGAVPVVRFVRSWDGRSKLDDVVPIQDRINKLTGDKIVAGEFGAFPQRWALTNDDPPSAVLKAGAGAVWVIPPSSTSPDGNEDAQTTVGQFPVTELSNYDGTIQAEVSALFMVAALPRHLMFNPGVAPSGEAIKADEGPAVAHARGFVRKFTASWRQVMKLCGVKAQPVWDDVEVHNELTAAQAFSALTTAGMPLRMAAEYALDLPEEELAELDKLPLPPQPGAASPGQNATPAPAQQRAQPKPRAPRPAASKS
jgi:Phage portal protein, SPP1 Gp6-like